MSGSENKNVIQSIITEEIDTILLDMDGTLLDLNFDDHVWNRRLPQRYAERHKITLTAAQEQISEKLGAVRGTIQWYCFDHWQDLTGIDLLDVEQELYHLVKVRPGARALLEQLSDGHYQIVLATNADRRSMERKLEHTQIAHFFDHIVSSHDFGVAKESPSFWSQLSEFVRFDPKRSLFVDDNHNVLKAAKDFGVRYTFGVGRPNTEGEIHTSTEFYCLESFAELKL